MSERTVRHMPFAPVKKNSSPAIQTTSGHTGVTFGMKIARRLAAIHGISEYTQVLYVRNRARASCVRYTGTRKNGILSINLPIKYSLSARGFEFSMKNGYDEYSSIKYMVTGAYREPKGMEAAYYIAVHEFAHVLQVCNNIWTYTASGRRQVHGASFVSIMNSLIKGFPYNLALEL